MRKTKPRARPPDARKVRPTRFMWVEYERRKAQLQAMTLTPDEYERQIKRIADELGI